MQILPHAELPIVEVPRIRTRVHAGHGTSAADTSVWEQWIAADGFIPLHYHDVEEVLVFLAGHVELMQDDRTTRVAAPATVIIPAGQVHGVRPAADAEVHLFGAFPTAAPRIYAPDGTPRPMPWDDDDKVSESPAASPESC